MQTLKTVATVAALAAGCWLPQAAQAQQVAYATYQLVLRAGPDVAYPVVSVLNPNVQVVVQGCLEDYRWCDVAYGPQRGWTPASDLRYASQGGYQPLPLVATAVGVAVVGFVLNDYWRHHYRERTWYHERDRWARQVPPYRPHYDNNRRDEYRRDDNRAHDRDRERHGQAPVPIQTKPAPVVKQPQYNNNQPRGATDPKAGIEKANPHSEPLDRP